MKPRIRVQTTIKTDIDKVWACWTKAEHITQWNFASDEWCCPTATNDLRPGSAFNWRMASRDGKMGFDFTGTYDQVIDNTSISYTMSDGRKVDIAFEATDAGIQLSESFEAEGTNADEMQRAGWQAILDNFRKYVESGW